MQQETAAYPARPQGLAPSTSAVVGKAAGTTSGGLSVRRLNVLRAATPGALSLHPDCARRGGLPMSSA